MSAAARALPRLKDAAPADWDEEAKGAWPGSVDWGALREEYAHLPARAKRPERRRRMMSVKQVLEWAVVEECARLEMGDGLGLARGMSAEARIAAQGDLGGVRIDTSPGRSLPCDAALDVMDVVAGLSPLQAALLVKHAHRGAGPDPRLGEVAQCEPLAWARRANGAACAKVTRGTTWSWVWRRVGRGPKRRVRHYHDFCEVTYSPTPMELAAARRDYQQWRLGLMLILPEIKRLTLPWITVTRELPPSNPWEKQIAEKTVAN